MSAPLPRKLAAILSADAENFSARMSEDEASAFSELRAARLIIDAQIAAFGGRIANTAGDGLIAEFPSVVQAVKAAVDMQQRLVQAGGTLPFRIGLHMGDVITHGEDLLGDGVNLAARVQSKADPGAVLVTQQVYDQMRGKIDHGFQNLGEIALKNMHEPIALYAVQANNLTTMSPFTPIAPTKSLKTSRKKMPLKSLTGICLGVWCLATLRATVVGTESQTTWIGLALAIFMILRLVSRLELARSESGPLRGLLIGAATTVAVFSQGQWLFWPALPLVTFAAYIAFHRFKAQP
jgi:adenylate cyclase